MKRKGIIISIIGIIIVALSLLGITFGYYYTQILGNENATSVKVTSAMKTVKYIELSEEVSDTVIRPGYEYIKTFAVTSLSNEQAIYHIYLDDVINEFTRIQDITYTLYRKSGNNTIDTSDLSDCEEISSGIFPKTNNYIKLNEKLLTKGDSYTYALKINYLESTEEQDIDNGKTFGFKVQIHGEIENPYVGDKTTLAYNIINNAIGLTEQEKEAGYAELVSTPPTKVAVETSSFIYTATDPTTFGSSKTATSTYYYVYADSYEINEQTGKYTLVNPQVGQYSSIYSSLSGKYITTHNGYSSQSAATTDAADGKTFSTIYKVSTTTSDVTSTTFEYGTLTKGYKGTESVISTTPDEYGTSYYYRGAVKNNYLSFNNMCWRIVRIEGDGAIKIVLADATAECSTATLTKTDSAYIGTGDYGYDSNSFADYENSANRTSSMKYKFNIFLNGGSFESGYYDEKYNWNPETKTYTAWSTEAKSKLKSTTACIGDTTTKYDDNGNILTDTVATELGYWNYNSYIKLYGKGQTANATLMCNATGGKTSETQIFPLTADEVVFAGGKVGESNYTYYLIENATTNYWWTLSLYNFVSCNDFTFYVEYYGNVTSFEFGTTYDGNGLRPAVSLISGVKIVNGDGSISNPYTIQ